MGRAGEAMQRGRVASVASTPRLVPWGLLVTVFVCLLLFRFCVVALFRHHPCGCWLPWHNLGLG